VVADEQKTIDLYFRSGLIKNKLHATDVVDRSFAAAIEKGAGLWARTPSCRRVRE
jgi:sulfonate transport system substrate-binding protein